MSVIDTFGDFSYVKTSGGRVKARVRFRDDDDIEDGPLIQRGQASTGGAEPGPGPEVLIICKCDVDATVTPTTVRLCGEVTFRGRSVREFSTSALRSAARR